MSLQLTAITAEWTVVPGPGSSLRVLEGATVLVRDRTIVEVLAEPDLPASGRIATAQHVDLPDALLTPGFVNLHNHALNGPLFRGVVDDIGDAITPDDLVHALLLPLGDLAAELLDEEEVRAVYWLALLGVLASGTTTVLDVPRAAHHGLFDVARELGLRVVGAPYLFSAPSRGLDATGRTIYEQADEDASLAAVLALHDAYDQGPGGRVRVGFGPHATDTCSPRLLHRIGEQARERDAVVTVHVAQSHQEVRAVRAAHGRSPVRLLHDAGLLGPATVLAHAVYVPDDDLALLRDTGTTLAHCPLTFARSAVTVSFDRFHRAGVRTGIGTDAYNFDILGELRAAGFVAKLTSGDPAAGDARTLLHAATAIGGAVLGPAGLGRIEPGAPADLTAVSLGRAGLQPVRDPVRNLVWNATPADVALVVVDGQILLRDGVVQDAVGHRIDERAVGHAASAAVHRLWRAAERAGILAAQHTGIPA